jgi:hypothetical protein
VVIAERKEIKLFAIHVMVQAGSKINSEFRYKYSLIKYNSYLQKSERVHIFLNEF